MQKKFKNTKKIPKLTKIWYETIYDVYCLYKKFWSQISIWSSLWLQILTNPSQLSGTSSEILRFVSNGRANFCETSSIFYHSLHVWYHNIITNLMIFWLHLLFIEFKNNPVARSWSCFMNMMFEFSFEFFDNASNWTQ